MKDPSRLFRITLLAASLLTIVLLVIAALRENFFAQWYQVQRDYREILKTKASDAAGQELERNFRVELKQVAIPALGVVDRCVACHNGIDDPRMTDVALPHRVHSGNILKHHPADRYGCTTCHQGQGAATNFHDAKAEDAFWDYPLLPANLTQATCTSCHDLEYLAGKVPEQVTLLRAGRKLFSDKSCGSCHKIGGRGGTLGRALDNEGLRTKHQFVLTNLAPPHTTWRWHQAHLLDPGGIVPGSQMINPGVTEGEAKALSAYILSLRQRDVPESYLAADKIEQKFRALHPAPRNGDELYRSYCAACHRPEGQGSNYANLGVRPPAIGSADFLDLAPDAFILSTLETGRPERKMPAWAGASASMSAEEARSLVAFIRNRAPRAPTLAEVEGSATNRELGERTYQSDCAACHGERGEGTPLGSPLATGDRRATGRAALYRVMAEGVAKTAMPRYSAYDAATLRAVLDYTSSLQSVPGSRAAWKKGVGNAVRGQEIFAKSCAGCHGDRGQGNTGPGLGTPGFQKVASEEYIAATVMRGRAGTPMPAFGRDNANYPRLSGQEVLDVAAFVRGGLSAQPTATETVARVMDRRR